MHKGRPFTIGLLLVVAIAMMGPWGQTKATQWAKPELAALQSFIINHYPEQLTNPQKKKRKSLSQFGYGLWYFPIPFFTVSEFIDPDNYGEHSYSQPGKGEQNGAIYTCKGGFIDFSHVRAGIDWSVYLAFKLVLQESSIRLPDEAGTLNIKLRNLDNLSIEDRVSLAQKIAFERLVWHEIASWHYHWPNHIVNEQQSTFTPEDVYSNLLGTLIGKKIALRILTKQESLSFSQIATQEIDIMMETLMPLSTKKDSKLAYDIVDRHKQKKLPEAQRNKDVWYDSDVTFRDVRYVFKRNMNIGPTVGPWLVPHQEVLGCPCNAAMQNLQVPTETQTGQSLYDYYEFAIHPDSSLFFAKKSGKQLHEPFGDFTTKNIARIVDHIGEDMQHMLLPGFDKRDSNDPIPQYKHVKHVIF